MPRQLMCKKGLLAAAVLVAFLAMTAIAFADDNPEKVLVLYNNSSNYNAEANGNGVKDSYELALAYAVKRGIPLENLLGLQISVNGYYYTADQDGCGQFFNDIMYPVQNKLNAIGQENIDYIAVSDRVPYIVSSIRSMDSFLAIPFTTLDACLNWTPNNQFLEASPTVGMDKGHFDHSYKQAGYNMYLVSRFWGVPIDGLKDQIYGALYAEKYLYNQEGRYRGTGYVDARDKYSNFGKVWSAADLAAYPFGYSTLLNMDKSIACTHKHYELRNYPYKREVTDYEIGEAGAEYIDGTPASIAEDMMFYSGWYNYNKYRDSYRWLPGSTACELNSNSDSFLSEAVKRGLTSGTGVVDEPGGSGGGHPYCDVFIYYMLNGYNLAESGWHSIPTFKSRSVVLGDPIYNPMKQKAIATDSSLSRELVAFDEAVQGLAGQERKISVYLAEGPEPEMADFRLEYGATQAMASNIDYNYYYGSKREFILKGLSAATTYYYRITAKDPAGNTKASSMREFTTAQSDSEGIFSLNLLQDKTLIEPGQGISFTSSSNCQDCTYTWQFGDCSQASGTGQMHHYSEEGVYDVFLVAKNSKGISKSARGIVFAYLGQACETGETQECQKQQGVCAGSQQQCAAGSWPGCSDANYSQYSQDYEPAETTKCSDAKDNDCDGLSDCTDPDCASNQDCASACSDGTAILECSTNKPLYCSEDRLLVNDCNRCDCPSGLECNSQNSLCEVECVTMTVLMGYIGQWKTGNLNMATLMQKINKWKTGEGC